VAHSYYGLLEKDYNMKSRYDELISLYSDEEVDLIEYVSWLWFRCTGSDYRDKIYEEMIRNKKAIKGDVS